MVAYMNGQQAVAQGMHQRRASVGNEWPDAPELAQHLSALTDPFRLQIVRILAERREMTVSDLVRSLGRSQPLISFHLKFLREAGLVRKRQAGRQAFYALEADHFARLQVLLGAMLPARTRRRYRNPDGGILGEPPRRHTCPLCAHIPPYNEEE